MDTKTEVGSNSDTTGVVRQLSLMSRDELIHYWPKIELALDETRPLWQEAWTKDDLLAQALTGNVFVWAITTDEVIHVVLFTQFYKTYSTKIFQIFWAYGEGLLPLMPLLSTAFDHFAAQAGAGRIEIQGRKGFEKLLRRHRFEPDYIVYSRAVETPRGN